MCDRCEFDLMMYGAPPEPVRKPPEKPKFTAEAIENGPDSATDTPTEADQVSPGQTRRGGKD